MGLTDGQVQQAKDVVDKAISRVAQEKGDSEIDYHVNVLREVDSLLEKEKDLYSRS
jgi:hypothetical protein